MIWDFYGLKTWLVAKRAVLRDPPQAGELEIILLRVQRCRPIASRMLCELESKMPPQCLVITCYSMFSSLHHVITCYSQVSSLSG